MLITGKRVHSLDRYMRGVPAGAAVIVGIGEIERFRPRLLELGFSEHLNPGERILPARVGTRSRFNAEGRYQVHRDQPKEMRVVGQREWHWKEFRGPYQREEMSRIVDVVRECYPRTFVAPPSVELSVAVTPQESKFIVSDRMIFDASSRDLLLHVINLFLELFNEAETLSEDLEGYIVSEVRRLNWVFLPAGRMPWQRLRRHLTRLVRRAPRGNRPVLMHRLHTINSYGPTFTAVGHGGFAGYIVFGFPDRDLYVLESLYYGNATYVFGERWEELSRRTKAEILTGHHQKARIVHRQGWEGTIGALLS
jgi:hypothetical protein